MKKIETLQAFRAIAALLVVLFHVTSYMQDTLKATFLGGLFTFGLTGVDFFFVLSGFIIFYVHGADIGRSDRLRGYVLKRAIRIYPICWLITLTKVAAIFLVPGFAKSYETHLDVIVKSLLLLPQVNLPIIGAAWTLSYEACFYVIFGVLVLIGRRYAVLLVATWATAIVCLVLVGTVAPGSYSSPYLLTFILNERNLEFLFGCASAYLLGRYKIPKPRILVGLGILTFFASGIVIDRGAIFPLIIHTLLFGGASFLIVSAGADLELAGSIKVPQWLVFLGDASYSIYLTAFAFVNVILVIFAKLSLLPIMGTQLVGVVTAVLAVTGGAIVYRQVERPLLNWLRRKTTYIGRPVGRSLTPVLVQDPR